MIGKCGIHATTNPFLVERCPDPKQRMSKSCVFVHKNSSGKTPRVQMCSCATPIHFSGAYAEMPFCRAVDAVFHSR